MVAVVRLTYETMLSALGTYGLSRTQHSHNIQQADSLTPSAMMPSLAVRVEEILMAVEVIGAELGKHKISVACTGRILSRAGARA